MTNDLKENIEIEGENQLDSNMKLLRSLRFQHIVDINMVRVFFVVLLASAVVAMIPTLRPKYSEVEKRDLQTFPRFTFKALVSGDYFDAINLWFSDTFPARDTFVEINTNVTNLFGINTVQVHGKLDEADEIPDVDNIESTQSKPQEESKPAEAPPPPVQPVVEQLGAILIVDNAAFEYYNFKQDVADNYINTLNRAATVLEGKSKVYDMIIPTSMGITLPQSVRDTVKSSDQKSAIDYMYSKMIPAVSRVDCYGKLMSKRDEYIYFRTDHHWTALGAYYSYRE
ncbi:MAG: DHHW family protein, partial [Acutalibacteraceae bacterium]|nr:DHHW family protein [Acutalibacteraceae bacterium]